VPHKVVNTINGACLIGGPVFFGAHETNPNVECWLAVLQAPESA
jgi:hypothetical protein